MLSVSFVSGDTGRRLEHAGPHALRQSRTSRGGSYFGPHRDNHDASKLTQKSSNSQLVYTVVVNVGGGSVDPLRILEHGDELVEFGIEQGALIIIRSQDLHESVPDTTPLERNADVCATDRPFALKMSYFFKDAESKEAPGEGKSNKPPGEGESNTPRKRRESDKESDAVGSPLARKSPRFKDDGGQASAEAAAADMQQGDVYHAELLDESSKSKLPVAAAAGAARPTKSWTRRSDHRLSGQSNSPVQSTGSDQEIQKTVQSGKAKATPQSMDEEWKELATAVREKTGRHCAALGDGFCWCYSIMGSFGLLECPSNPSPRDYMVVSRVLQEAKEGAGNCSWLSESDAHAIKNTGAPPVRRLTENNYGGPKLWFRYFAWLFVVPIIVLNREDIFSSFAPRVVRDLLERRKGSSAATIRNSNMTIVKPTSNRAPNVSLSLLHFFWLPRRRVTLLLSARSMFA